MRSLTPKYRLVGFTLPEVVRALSGSCAELQYEVKLNGRKLKEGPMISALILAFVDMPPKEQKEFVKKGVAKLEALMQLDDPFDMAETPTPKTTTHHEPGKGSSSGSKPSSRRKLP